jgi:hypothetical protein
MLGARDIADSAVLFVGHRTGRIINLLDDASRIEIWIAMLLTLAQASGVWELV